MDKKILNFYDLENLKLYYDIENLNICLIDDVQFNITIKDIGKIFPNNKIYDISKSFNTYLIETNNKFFKIFKIIFYFNESQYDLDRILKYYTGIIIVNYKIAKYFPYFIDKFGNYYVYEIE